MDDDDDDDGIFYGIVWKSPMDRCHYCKLGFTWVFMGICFGIQTYDYIWLCLNICTVCKTKYLGIKQIQFDVLICFNKEHHDQSLDFGLHHFQLNIVKYISWEGGHKTSNDLNSILWYLMLSGFSEASMEVVRPPFTVIMGKTMSWLKHELFLVSVPRFPPFIPLIFHCQLIIPRRDSTAIPYRNGFLWELNANGNHGPEWSRLIYFSTIQYDIIRLFPWWFSMILFNYQMVTSWSNQAVSAFHIEPLCFPWPDAGNFLPPVS